MQQRPTALMNLVRQPKNIGDIYKTVEQGGATAAWAAVSKDFDRHGGVFLENVNIAPAVSDGPRAPHGVKSWALDPQAANQLWALCEQMTGMRSE